MHFGLLGRVLTALVAFALPGLAHADSLYEEGMIVYGSVTTISNAVVTVNVACTGPVVQLKWAEIERITFDDKCDAPAVRPSIAALWRDPCPSEAKGVMYSVSFHSGGLNYVSHVIMTDTAVIQLARPTSAVAGPRSDVASIYRDIRGCSSWLLKPGKWPGTFSPVKPGRLPKGQREDQK